MLSLLFPKRVPPLPVIAIAGDQGAGKSTVVELVREVLDWESRSTSDMLIDMLAWRLKVDPKTIRRNKQEYRERLQEFGDLLEKDSPASLMRLTYESAGSGRAIVESVRRLSEVWYLDKLKAHYLLVEAPRELREERRGGLVGEDHATEGEASRFLRSHKNCYIIKNDKDLEHLKAEVHRFLERFI